MEKAVCNCAAFSFYRFSKTDGLQEKIYVTNEIVVIEFRITK